MKLANVDTKLKV